MSYTYLQEQGEESSAECFSDIPQSVLLRLNLTAEKSYSKDNETASFPSSQSGMMSAPSTANLGEEKSMSSVEVSPVKTLVLEIAKQKESMDREVDYGLKCRESLAKFDQNTHSWRTRQCLLFEDLGESLEIFPEWGMTRNGELLEVAIPGGIINDYECGLSHTYPTPCAKVTSPRGKAAQERKGNPMDTLPNVVGGVPHPHLSEWLLAWPKGWTDLKPLEMDNVQLWLQQHGEFLEENE